MKDLGHSLQNPGAVEKLHKPKQINKSVITVKTFGFRNIESKVLSMKKTSPEDDFWPFRNGVFQEEFRHKNDGHHQALGQVSVLALST